MNHSKIYIVAVAVMFFGMVIVLTMFPRSTYSELERRELATFPEFSMEKLKSGQLTRDIANWFSDSEPFRDKFMTLNMEVKDRIALRLFSGDNVVTIIDNAGGGPVAAAGDMGAAEENGPEMGRAKVAARGIIVVGVAPNARALMRYAGSGGGGGYARAVNKYRETFGKDVNIYCMIIPPAAAYYMPAELNGSSSVYETVKSIHSKLSPGVKPVEIFSVLEKHTKEPIYLRTDHHWAPLGAFYAAKQFAAVAKVPFRDLNSYERKVTHGFVGTMYGYSNDINVKKSPEDFVYYVPKGIAYETTYTNYKIDEDYQVMAEFKPVKGQYFNHFKDGSGGAYSTFMGGDSKITHVRTGTKNGRRLMIIKDSFGNALPGYLFYSFEDIHVIDFRYFKKNMKEYVRKHGITDILFAANAFRAFGSTGKETIQFLTQPNGVYYTPKAKESSTAPQESSATSSPEPQPSSKPSPQPAEKRVPQPETQSESSTPASAKS